MIILFWVQIFCFVFKHPQSILLPQGETVLGFILSDFRNRPEWLIYEKRRSKKQTTYMYILCCMLRHCIVRHVSCLCEALRLRLLSLAVCIHCHLLLTSQMTGLVNSYLHFNNGLTVFLLTRFLFS
jgi:hypothetical protein